MIKFGTWRWRERGNREIFRFLWVFEVKIGVFVEISKKIIDRCIRHGIRRFSPKKFWKISESDRRADQNNYFSEKFRRNMKKYEKIKKNVIFFDKILYIITYISDIASISAFQPCIERWLAFPTQKVTEWIVIRTFYEIVNKKFRFSCIYNEENIPKNVRQILIFFFTKNYLDHQE